MAGKQPNPPKRQLAAFPFKKSNQQGTALAHQSEAAVIAQQRRGSSVAPLSEIKPRAHGDTRPLKLAHVQAIAESLPVQGLLQPVVIDRESFLLAGGHRLAAVMLLGVVVGKVDEAALLAQPFLRPTTTNEQILAAVATLKEHRDEEQLQQAWRQHFELGVPVRQLELNSRAEDDVQIAKAVEMIENAQRLNYTTAEMKSIVEDYRGRGYVETTGRPKVGTRALAPALEVVFGVSYNTVRRLLEREVSKPKRSIPAASFDGVLTWASNCRDSGQLNQVATVVAESLSALAQQGEGTSLGA